MGTVEGFPHLLVLKSRGMGAVEGLEIERNGGGGGSPMFRCRNRDKRER